MNITQKIKPINSLIIGNDEEKQQPIFWAVPLIGGFRFYLKFWIGKKNDKQKDN